MVWKDEPNRKEVMKMEIFDANVLYGFWPQRKLDSSLDAVKELAFKHGVKKMLITSMRGIMDDFFVGNEETLDICKHNSNLLPVATINPHRFLGTEAAIEKYLNEGVKVFRFFPNYQHWPYNFAPFHRILKLLSDKGKIVILPSRVGGHHSNGIITEIAALADTYSLNFIITGMYYGNLSEALTVAQEHPNVFLETHLLNSPDGLEIVCDNLKVENVIYGSETPFNYINSSLLPVLNAKISQENKEKILYQNIARLLR
jgi:predicted TIM-barrel fold metal-dependent hydrolase